MKRIEMQMTFPKTLALGIHDTFAVLCIAGLLSLGLAAPAYAYVDPSVMTYTIQALAGVAVALSAVAGVAFRRTRKALFKLLNIDENARREKDPAWQRTADAATTPVVHAGDKVFLQDAPVAAALSESAESIDGSSATASEKTPSPKRCEDLKAIPWPKRFLLALLAVGFPGFTLGIVAPYEIVAGNPDSLYYGLSDIAGIIAVAVCAAILAASLVLSLFRGKAFRVLAVLCVTAGVGFWIQALFLNINMPLMNGTPINFWGDHTSMMIISTVVWLIIFGLVAFAYIKRPKQTFGVSFVVAAALVLVQSVGVISLFAEEDSTSLFVTEDGLYEVTEENNVVVFVLDHFDTKFFDDVLAEYPEALEEMDGFTWYTDDSGMMLPTLFAVPYMLTGVTPDPDEDIHDYYRNRYLNSSLISDLTSTGYTLGLYTSDIQSGYFTTEEVQTLFGNTTVNVHELEELDVNTLGTIKTLIRAALFRDMPWILKEPFGYYTDALNQHVLNINAYTVDDEGNVVLSDPAQTPYIIDDVAHKEELEAYGLTITEGVGSVKLIHFNGAHLPFTMDINGNRVAEDSVTQIEQAAGALRIVGNYLAEMKRLGVYDDATIIITADHGDWYASTEIATMVSTPIMLVKESGDTWEELQTSDKQISHANMIATLVAAVGADASAYGPTLANAPQESTRYFYHITTIDDRVKGVWEFEITGNANDFSNWHYTGNYWVVEGEPEQ